MKELLEWMEYIEDVRQVRHALKDILGIRHKVSGASICFGLNASKKFSSNSFGMDCSFVRMA